MSTTTPIHVLHVDDEPAFAEMVAEFLTREDDQIEITTATSAADGLTHLEDTHFDCIVSDYDMPAQNGIEFLNAVRDTHPDLPFILFTGKGSEEIASDAISAGVTDYLQKEGGTGQYTLLAHRITNAVAQHRSKREIEASQERLSLFFEQSPLGAIEWTDDFDIARINDTAEDILGYDENELVGSSWNRLVPDSQHDDVADVFSELLTDSTAYDIEQKTVTKNGERLVCEWHHRVVRDELGDIVTMFSKFQDVTDRVQRQQKLAKERAFTEQALDTLDDVFYVIDADGTLTRWNERVGDITGYSDVELDGLNARELFAEDDHARIEDAIRTAIDTGDVTIEAAVLSASGEQIPHELTGKRLTDPHGEFLGIVGVGRDLSERKEREAELRFVHDLLDRTERIADVGGWEIDTETDEVFWTEHLFDMLGVEYENAPSLEEALNVYLEEDRPHVASAIEDAVAAGESFDVEARFQRPDGEIRWLRIQGEPALEDGEVVTLRGAVRDITDYKERERDLEQARREYEELFNGMNDTGWVLDPDGTILAVNDAAVETLGYSREEILSMTPHDFDAETPDAEISRLIADMPEDETQVIETVHETKSGERVPIEISSSLISYEGRTVVLSVGRDISDRKQREEQLERFASIVSHDLRNPLNVAQGNLDLAQEDCDSDFLDQVARAHERMQTLIADLLTLAHEGNQVSDLETIDLRALAEDCWQTVETADATLQVETNLHIRADRSRLKQLLENLFRNAVEHGGEAPTITIGDHSSGFYIADDGPGIPPTEREQALETGYSTTTDGTGLGLSIANQIADAHNWEITLTTSADDGLRVEISNINETE
ncbi:PAS domain S-box protein [Halobacterium sp. KA-6]|jgi:PAS domain S-box-containing protein|uniref:PAS domain S-box protein n=1 Tax=Halobacterium sp. KA-6 TaxID=2896368 RepID=UPI001E498438|nr:PAS domain S-box protein [Halobacterium sp. KA-6]MCD2203295.1 PAS domain S-box protein [Halobacterium sp. KA-6]